MSEKGQCIGYWSKQILAGQQILIAVLRLNEANLEPFFFFSSGCHTSTRGSGVHSGLEQLE